MSIVKYYLCAEKDFVDGDPNCLTLLEGASSMEEALRTATDLRVNKWGDEEPLVQTGGDCPHVQACVLAVAEKAEIDLGELARTREAAKRDREAKAREEAELRELARLEEKYGSRP